MDFLFGTRASATARPGDQTVFDPGEFFASSPANKCGKIPAFLKVSGRGNVMEMIMVFLGGASIGALIGAVIAWKVKPCGDGTRVAAAEARVEELRTQLDAARAGFDGLRRRLEEAEAARIAAETRVRDTGKYIAEQKTLLEDAKTRLSETFDALAAKALADNSKGFLTLAEAKFNSLKIGAEADLESRKRAIEMLVTPLSEALAGYQGAARDLEEKRLREISAVGEQLKSLGVAQMTLQNETAKLVNALKSPQVRGRWGEIALRKTAELAGMSGHCDFIEQESVTTEGGRLRPDMVVKLPAGREVVVDSKVSMAGFIEALEAKTDAEREAALTRHAAQINQHVKQLSAKEYWDQFPSAPEFVVLFIPNDSFLAAAAERDPNLVENALGKQVVIATPTTFIALLKAIAFGWRQEALAENAERISALGQEISDRIATIVEHFNSVGKSLGKAVESYNAATSSFETRLLSSARKFRELGAGGRKEIEPVEVIDHLPRSLGNGGAKDPAKP
ncbi:MAG: DNA recombination protein RmuC [Candidatus Omnitrophica bacterium ADurb.Bin314]|jgi:DNA recombination protein RmuC|nr:MAG: DNA recombination protein RmuC [Candidatus Omnitrophica bacterium ADurb.Bin314]